MPSKDIAMPDRGQILSRAHHAESAKGITDRNFGGVWEIRRHQERRMWERRWQTEKIG
jgi:hypothetical protein